MTRQNKKNREEAKEYILKIAKEHDVKFIRLWFSDILGMLLPSREEPVMSETAYVELR